MPRASDLNPGSKRGAATLHGHGSSKRYVKMNLLVFRNSYANLHVMLVETRSVKYNFLSPNRKLLADVSVYINEVCHVTA